MTIAQKQLAPLVITVNRPTAPNSSAYGCGACSPVSNLPPGGRYPALLASVACQVQRGGRPVRPKLDGGRVARSRTTPYPQHPRQFVLTSRQAVSMTKTRILKSRMTRKCHVRFGSGGRVGRPYHNLARFSYLNHLPLDIITGRNIFDLTNREEREYVVSIP